MPIRHMRQVEPVLGQPWILYPIDHREMVARSHATRAASARRTATLNISGSRARCRSASNACCPSTGGLVQHPRHADHPHQRRSTARTNDTARSS